MSFTYTHMGDLGEHEYCSNDPGFDANRELGDMPNRELRGMPNSLFGCVGGNACPV